ncbi:MAG: type I restriction endonuclease subunit R, partial [Candidatus Delongbacteria bacterium]|nr:type I restriction endonuclease subunit R [Candidatus Delongbacteria bacterium]
MKFTEEKLEHAYIELLESEGYSHQLGITIVRNDDDVIIEDDFIQFLLAKYQNQQLTQNEAKTILLQLKTLPASDLYDTNKTIMRWLSDGFILKREDRSKKDIHIELIDYNGLEAQLASENLDSIVADPQEKYPKDYNIYKFVNQIEITGTQKRIPDGIIYINGLPLVVFEFKSAIREEATVFNAYEQLTKRYRRDIPELFKYNAFCVISDGVNNKAGSFFAPYEFYYAWRRIAG